MPDGVNPLGPLGPYQPIIGKVQKLVEAYQFFSSVDKAGHVVLEKNVKETTDEETGVVITETTIKEKYDPKKAEEKASAAIIATKLGEAAQAYAEIVQEIMKLLHTDNPVINMGDDGSVEESQADAGILSTILGGITGQQPSNPLHKIAGELGVGVGELEALLKKMVNEKKESEKTELDGILKHVKGNSSSDIVAGIKAFVEDKKTTDSGASIEGIVKKYGGFDNLIEKLQKLKSSKEETIKSEQILEEKNKIIEETKKILEADLTRSKNQIVALSEALTKIAEGDAEKVKNILARQGGVDPLLKALSELA